MFDLTTALSLSIISFISSALIIIRVLFSLLPITFENGQLTRIQESSALRHVLQSQHAYLWLTVIDLISSASFIWEAFEQHYGGMSGSNEALSIGSTTRLWVATTFSPICLFSILLVSLLSARKKVSTTFGRIGWKVWAPTTLIGVSSTGIAVVFAHERIRSFFPGTPTCIFIMTIANSCVLLCQSRVPLVEEGTESSAAKGLNGNASAAQFAAEDIEALKNRDSWVTSIRNSTRTSFSSFSFDTSNTLSRVEEGQITEVPIARHNPSRSGFLTAEPANVSAPMLKSAWSMSTTVLGASARPAGTTHDRRTLSAIPAHIRSEIAMQTCCGKPSSDPNLLETGRCCQPIPKLSATFRRDSLIWVASLWLLMALSIPYLVSSGQHTTDVPFILSMTLRAPFLALSLFVAPLPLFEMQQPIHDRKQRFESLDKRKSVDPRWSSSSVTVVGDRRSGDVWLSKGEAVEGKGKLGRAASLLVRHPKLVVLPPKEEPEKIEKELGGRDEKDKGRGNVSGATGMSSYVALERERPQSADVEVEVEMDVAVAEVDEGDSADVTNISYPSVETNHDTIENVAAAHASVLSLPSSLPASNMEPALPSATTSLRRSSGSTRGSKASKLFRAFLKPELEPIPDMSFSSMPHSRSETSLLRVLKMKRKSGEDGGSTLVGSTGTSSKSKPRAPLRVPSNGSQASRKSSMAIDSLSAKVLPILVPGIKIGPDTEVQQTPERNQQPMQPRPARSFSSPEMNSSPPLQSTVRLLGKGPPPSTRSISRNPSTTRSVISSSDHHSDENKENVDPLPSNSGTRSLSAASRRSKKCGTPPSSFKMLPLPEPPIQAPTSQDMPVDPMKPISRGRSHRYPGIPSRFRSPPPAPPKEQRTASSASSHSSLIQLGLAITSDEPDPFRRASMNSATSVNADARRKYLQSTQARSPRSSPTMMSVQEATELLSDTVQTRGTSSSGTTSGTSNSLGFLRIKPSRSRFFKTRSKGS